MNPDRFSLKDRVAIVTGGAGAGYGAQITTALAEAGAHVVVTSRVAQKAERVAEELRGRGLSVSGEPLEVSNEWSVSELVSCVLGNHKRIDILVNNAAECCTDPLETVRVEDWNRVLAANITGTMLLSRAVAPAMRERGAGVVINVSSIYGLVSPDPRIYGRSGLNSPLVYGATKAAILQMTRYLAVHWAPVIRVNAITPGGLFADQDPEFARAYEERTPLRRMAGPDDLKGVVLLLASEASAFVTGQNFVVDGGWTAW